MQTFQEHDLEFRGSSGEGMLEMPGDTSTFTLIARCCVRKASLGGLLGLWKVEILSHHGQGTGASLTTGAARWARRMHVTLWSVMASCP